MAKGGIVMKVCTGVIKKAIGDRLYVEVEGREVELWVLPGTVGQVQKQMQKQAMVSAKLLQEDDNTFALLKFEGQR